MVCNPLPRVTSHKAVGFVRGFLQDVDHCIRRSCTYPPTRDHEHLSNRQTLNLVDELHQNLLEARGILDFRRTKLCAFLQMT